MSLLPFITRILCVLVMCIGTSHAASPVLTLDTLHELKRQNLPELALDIIDQSQPVLDAHSVHAWLVWERERFSLLHQLNRWPDLLEFASKDASKAMLDTEEHQWFEAQKVTALLALEHHAQALVVLRDQLWADTPLSSEQAAHARRQIIQAYTGLGLVDDAQRALRRYRQDYGTGDEQDTHWLLLQAQLLIDTGHEQDVFELLAQVNTPEAEALRFIASHRTGKQSAATIRAELNRRLENPELGTQQQAVYRYVLLYLADYEKDLKGRIEQLEAGLLSGGFSGLSHVFADLSARFSADALWQAYRDYGLALSNQYKLLRGDDEAWYLKASKLIQKQPLQARALLAVLAFEASDPRHAEIALLQIAESLDAKAGNLPLISHLFLDSRHFTDGRKIPLGVRYRLIDYALSQGKLETAARLMEDLQQPPQGEDVFAWNLRRARVLILGGHHAEGAAVLIGLISSPHQTLSEQAIDHYMQVAFDLQNVEQHELALQAFDKLELLELTPKLRRELAFWKAESKQKLKQYEQAALLFVQSARPLDGKLDPWYQTATFRSAEALAQAGLIEDARHQYLKLLKMTASATRQAVIRQRLQELHLSTPQPVESPR